MRKIACLWGTLQRHGGNKSLPRGNLPFTRQRSTLPAAAATESASTANQCPFNQASKSMVTTRPRRPRASLKEEEGLPFSEVPTPRGLPILGTTLDLMRAGSVAKIHEYVNSRHAQLGPIYKETLGTVEAVFVADADMTREVFRHEGEYPRHLLPEPWIVYNEKYHCRRGLFFMDGEEWLWFRRILSRLLLKQSTLVDYHQAYDHVVTSTINRLDSCRKDGVIMSLDKELYRWSIESLMALLFGLNFTRTHSEFAGYQEEFVSNIHQIFEESAQMTLVPPKLAAALNLPVWRRFTQAVDSALSIATTFVSNKLSELGSDHSSVEQDGILHKMKEENMSEEDIVRIVADLFLAAADTTSYTAQWALYLLGKHPEVQEKLLKEVQSVCPDGQPLTPSQVSHLGYLKRVVKEALRLYPIAPFLTRFLPEDCVLGGYKIPAGKLILLSIYTNGRNPSYFSEPQRFWPERWERGSEDDSANFQADNGPHGTLSDAYACLPFGFGTRSCIGRRIAELQMYVLIGRLVQSYNLEIMNKNDVDMVMRMIAVPSEPTLLKLTER